LEERGIPIAPGTLVAGRYRVGSVIQRGGMGVIYAAVHETLEQKVALKVLLPAVAHDPANVDRFLREARACVKLKNDHVVRVFDVGQHDDAPFMAMELLDGADLSSVIASRAPLPCAEAVGILLEALEAIIEAHAAGIVHRDLKPSNLFLEARADGTTRVKVLDFGISKIVDKAEVGLTTTRSMLGSPGYMSPEQVKSAKAVDERTDIWALGVIMWEMLTGEIAFDGETLGEVFAKIREDTLASVSSKRPDVPAALAAIVARCVERNRDQRFPDATALRDALLAWDEPEAPAVPRRTVVVTDASRHDDLTLSSSDSLDALPLSAAPAASEVERPLTLAQRNSTASTWTASTRRAPTTRWLVLATALVAAVAAAVWWSARPNAEPTAEAKEPPAPAREEPSAPAGPTTAPSPPVVEASATAAPSAEATGQPSARPTSEVRSPMPSQLPPRRKKTNWGF
jgi:eukaryotic-like serine/threonine-protein kinase